MKKIIGWNNSTCKKCEKDFYWTQAGLNAPGCKEREYLECPYCGEVNGSEMTPLVFISKRSEDLL